VASSGGDRVRHCVGPGLVDAEDEPVPGAQVTIGGRDQQRLAQARASLGDGADPQVSSIARRSLHNSQLD
jgi:hypothetical protein